MALYHVTRIDADTIKPGSFVDAYVVAGGTAQARKAVAHLVDGKAKLLRATRVDLTSRTYVLNTYWDERTEELPEPEPFGHMPARYVNSHHGSDNFSGTNYFVQGRAAASLPAPYVREADGDVTYSTT